jgi:predicted ATPase/DNA-binding CsgD family transcriptional regulator
MTRGSVAARGRSVVIAVSQRRWGSPPPSPLTPLIGRRQELADACAMLRRGATRLLTLTGPGGIGKTRLALEIAATLDDDFDDGVVWVPLAAVSDPDSVIPTIAASVGIAGAAVDDRLVRALRDERLLLILDNFEHVVAAAPRIADLLAACPMLHAVVTSRSRLRIRGERVVPVPPLSLRHEAGAGSLAADQTHLATPLTLHSEAATLFFERAQAVVPEIEVSEDNAAVVAEICRRLDGLPLAIELAASRVGHLPLRSLLDRLDRRLPLLVGGDRDLPARQQTLRDAIAWSYDLLPPQEQLLFRCLAVFDGGFTIEGVEGVALRSGGEGGEEASRSRGVEQDGLLPTSDLRPPTRVPSPPPPPEAKPAPPERSDTPSVLDLVASLVEKSVVRHEPAPSGDPRYGMLETIREFAAERLAAAGEITAARQAHASWCLALAEREGLAHVLPAGERRLDALELERANMRAALTWWSASGQRERCLTHAAALGGFWYARIHVREGQEWLERALAESDGAPSPERASALVWLGLILFLRGDMPAAERRGTEGLALCRALGNAWADEDPSPGYPSDPLRRSRRALIESYALYTLGVAAFHRGDSVAAAARFGEGRAAAAAIPDSRMASIMVGKQTRSLGIIAGELGDFDEADRLYGEALRLFREVADESGIHRALGDLAYLALQRRDYAEALERFKAVLAQERDGPDSLALRDDLAGAATTAAYLHRSEVAVRCLAASEALNERLGLDTSLPGERSAWDGAVAASRSALGEDAFARAWAAGRTLRPDQAIAELLEISAAPSATPKIILSTRELDVLRLLVAGQTDREIGETLFISHRTVEFHVSRILAKLGVRKRGGAIAAALAAGLVEHPPLAQRLP